MQLYRIFNTMQSVILYHEDSSFWAKCESMLTLWLLLKSTCMLAVNSTRQSLLRGMRAHIRGTRHRWRSAVWQSAFDALVYGPEPSRCELALIDNDRETQAVNRPLLTACSPPGTTGSPGGNTLLTLAARRGHLRTVAYLVEERGVSVEGCAIEQRRGNGDRKTACHLALQQNHVAVARYLHRRGAATRTPLLRAWARREVIWPLVVLRRLVDRRHAVLSCGGEDDEDGGGRRGARGGRGSGSGDEPTRGALRILYGTTPAGSSCPEGPFRLVLEFLCGPPPPPLGPGPGRTVACTLSLIEQVAGAYGRNPERVLLARRLLGVRE